MDNLSSEEPRSRVFISCGQAKDTDELSTANAIAARLEKLGFDPYIAVEEQTLRGLKENIFGQLAKSEYYIFVDFKREKLSTVPKACRGSLFSHQELAIASFLDIPVLAFQERGIKQDDGIIRFLQANAIPFTDRNLLPNVIADRIQQLAWKPNWRNEIVLERDPNQFSKTTTFVASMDQSVRSLSTRFFHIDVRNRHASKIATNCYAYLQKMVNLRTATEIPIKTVECKWAGYMQPNAHILPQQARGFDALWIADDNPTRVNFNVHSDATDYIPRIEGEGRYELTYIVVADNFPAAKKSFILTLNQELELTRLEINGKK
jgi:hypothetical protein